MSVEILRRAAALMRERAEAATPGGPRWETAPDEAVPSRAYIFPADSDSAIASAPMDDAAHIASWHPAVALAAAVVLEDAIGQFEADQRTYDDELARGKYPYWVPTLNKAAVAFARAYLGESE